MCEPDLFNLQGQPILAWEAWPRPKRAYQWAEGYSAMELARAWFRSGKLECPSELTALLSTHPLTSELQRLRGCAEYVTPLPMRGEGRNHDMWLTGVSSGRGITVTIEAKGQESFGNPVGAHIAAAKSKNPNTGTAKRAAALFKLLLGRDVDPEALPYGTLYYQLLTAFAGTCIQAQKDGNSLAVLVVYEFTGPHLDRDKQKKNEVHLKASFDLLANGLVEFEPDTLNSPIRIPSGEILKTPIDLLVGKITAPVSSRGSTS